MTVMKRLILMGAMFLFLAAGFSSCAVDVGAGYYPNSYHVQRSHHHHYHRWHRDHGNYRY